MSVQGPLKGIPPSSFPKGGPRVWGHLRGHLEVDLEVDLEVTPDVLGHVSEKGPRIVAAAVTPLAPA